MTDVLIIGGGAAGMMAALTAAERGCGVLLLERQSRVGRKLLATGNGRCNLTNHRVSPEHYHGDEPSFCGRALRAFDVGTTLQYFASLGLLTVQEDSGRVYPMSNMAGSVLDVLRYALERPGVQVLTGQTVTALKKTAGGFTVRTETDTFSAERVILAAGGAAGSKVGGVMDGYRLAKGLGHHRTALYPSLVQVKTDPTYPRSLKGVKAECGISIRRGEHVLAQGRGEVLFTEYGVSGPAVFDLSRAVSTGGDGLSCVLDFFPDWESAEVLHWLRQRRQAMAGHEASTLPHPPGPDALQGRRLHQPERRRPHRRRPAAHRRPGHRLHPAHHRHLRLRSGPGHRRRPADGRVRPRDAAKPPCPRLLRLRRGAGRGRRLRRLQPAVGLVLRPPGRAATLSHTRPQAHGLRPFPVLKQTLIFSPLVS